MKKNNFPDYKNNNILNLMSSILHALGSGSKYNKLSLLDTKELSETENLVLIIIDGLGYDFLISQQNDSILHKNLKGYLTSLLPSTTATVLTTFLTGVSPEVHGVTGWYMYLKELGSIISSLPLEIRGTKKTQFYVDLNPGNLFYKNNIFNLINRDSFLIYPEDIVNSAFTNYYSNKSQKIAYKNITNFFEKINVCLKQHSTGKKFIFSYITEFDSSAHEYGVNSAETLSYYQIILKELEKFLQSSRLENTKIIITSDHGFIDTDENHFINLNNYPEINECLTLPLCGEPRFAYCYVRPSKTKLFEKLILDNFKDSIDLQKSEYLVKNHYFGLFTPDKKLYDRIGDYTLIMKENYIIKDFIYGEKIKFSIGNHGGVSNEEALVPLIIINK